MRLFVFIGTWLFAFSPLAAVFMTEAIPRDAPDRRWGQGARSGQSNHITLPGVSTTHVIQRRRYLRPVLPQAPGDGCFQLPVGPPYGRGYYVYRGFKTRHHLGEDWNGVGGGATDLGDPVYAAADGIVSVAEDFGGGWGNVVRIVHAYTVDEDLEHVETLYGHLDTMDVFEGDEVQRGDRIGSIGDAHGRYVPHLHFELRTTPGMRLGGGYDRLGYGYTDPRTFIETHRAGCP